MEEIFNKLKLEKKNTVENLIKWIMDSNFLDKAKFPLDKLRGLFGQVANKNDVQMSEFKDAISKIAAEDKKSPEDFTNMLSSEGSKFMDNLGSVAGAAAGALTGMLGGGSK